LCFIYVTPYFFLHAEARMHADVTYYGWTWYIFKSAVLLAQFLTYLLLTIFECETAHAQFFKTSICIAPQLDYFNCLSRLARKRRSGSCRARTSAFSYEARASA